MSAPSESISARLTYGSNTSLGCTLTLDTIFCTLIPDGVCHDFDVPKSFTLSTSNNFTQVRPHGRHPLHHCTLVLKGQTPSSPWATRPHALRKPTCSLN